jgi:urease accessory protein UreE
MVPRFENLAGRVGGQILDVRLKRVDAARGRARVRAPDGEDLVIDLPRGAAIHDGDAFGPSDKGICYRILIEPEQVLRISPEKKVEGFGDAVRLGYSLGNHHLEALIEGDSVYLPLTLGAEKLARLVEKAGVPVQTKVVKKVISPAKLEYYPGELEEGG